MARTFGLILGIILLAQGCAFGPKFDSNEYELLVDLNIATQRIHQACDSDIKQIRNFIDGSIDLSNRYWLYTKYLPNNSDSHEIAQIVRSHLQEAYERYHSDVPPSKYYCKTKFFSLVQKTNRALEATGKKVR